MSATKAQRESDKQVTDELVNSAPGGLDSLDRKIITRLQRDGRRAYGAMNFFKNLAQTVAEFPVRIMRLEFSDIADPPNVVANAIGFLVVPG